MDTQSTNLWPESHGVRTIGGSPLGTQESVKTSVSESDGHLQVSLPEDQFRALRDRVIDQFVDNVTERERFRETKSIHVTIGRTPASRLRMAIIFGIAIGVCIVVDVLLFVVIGVLKK